MSKVQKRKSLSLKDKQEIISKIQSQQSHTQLALEYGVKRQTISQIWKKKDNYLQGGIKARLDLKKCRRSEFEQIDQALFEWFRVHCDRKIPMSGPILIEKAKEFAAQFGLEGFKASSGWFEKWKRRHGICLRVISGEAGAVDLNSITEWKEKVWAPIASDYPPGDIYNCDETGLFWRLLPDKTLAFKNETCSGGKLSKERITVLLCCNLEGTDKLKPFVIGKSAKPRAFKRIGSIESIGVEYKANRSAWMTGALFMEWLESLNQRMKRKGRRILLLLDNCPAHPKLDFENVKLLFLPPNTTSVSQPLDQGIIQNFKVKYRGRLLRKIIGNIGIGQDPKIDLLDALILTAQSWNDVSSSCIKNCFAKAGFSGFVESSENGERVEVLPINAYLESANIQNVTVTEDEYANIDGDIATCALPTDQEIVDSLKPKEKEDDITVESDEDDSVEDVKPPVSAKDFLLSLDVAKKWLLQQKTPHAKEINFILALEDLGQRSLNAAYRQTQVTDFFQSAMP